MKRKTSILFILIPFALLFGCNDSLRSIIPAEEEKFYSPEELIVVFRTYEDSFLEIANIILENEPLEQMMIHSEEGIVSIWTETKSDCFVKDDWEKIEKLFHETGVSRIERNMKGGADAIRFIFRKDDTTTLYYFPTIEETNILYNTQFDSYVEKVDDEWWIGFSPSPY